MPRLVESYHVDYRRGETVYCWASGDTHVLRSIRADGPVADAFAVAAVRDAIAGAQRGEVLYPEFVSSASAASSQRSYAAQISAPSRAARPTGAPGGVTRAPGAVYSGGMRPTLILCGSLLLPCACGPDKGGEGEATASEATMATMSGEVPTTGGGETGGTGTATGGGTESTGGPDACAPFEDVRPSPEVTVVLRNGGAAPVFLSHVSECDDVPLFEMSGPDADTPVTWMAGTCGITCGQALAGACGCPAICAEATVLMIEPGGQHTLTWSGATYGPVMLPDACASESCGPQCLAQTQAAAGTYTLRARGATTATSCADPDVCTCTPNLEGWCDVPATGLGPETVEATAQLAYPSATMVEVVFGEP